MMTKYAFFRFHGKLNDFIARSDRHRTRAYAYSQKPSVKNAIEALRVPHPEVGLILLRGEPAEFSERLREDAFVEVFPHRHGVVGVRPSCFPMRAEEPARFILDVHLGALARYLRLLGFDTLYSGRDLGDAALSALAEKSGRILVSRDIGLLKRSVVAFGYWPRTRDPLKQLREVLDHFELRDECRPYSRCVHCNHHIVPIAKEKIVHLLPEKVRRSFESFTRCVGCDHVYWRGTHNRRLHELLGERAAS